MVEIPGVSDAVDAIKKLLPGMLIDLFNKVIDFLWNPLRPWLTDIANIANAVKWGFPASIRATFALGAMVETFFRVLPDFVAGAIIDGFNWWIDPVIDLIEGLIERAWDD